MTEAKQRQDDINTIGLILEWRPLCIVPVAELNAMSSHLRDKPYNRSCARVCEAVCAYRTCRKVMRHLMGLPPDEVFAEGCEAGK